MNSFDYVQVSTEVDALRGLAAHPDGKLLAGGTNLIDLMREGIETPPVLIDATRLPLSAVNELPDGGLHIGAMVKNSHLAGNPLVRERYPMLSQAILSGASAQLRNAATTGGNLLQRTRCLYFYEETARCNKRIPGSGCDALEGVNRINAVLGTSPQCIAVHPSDMCVALAALDARVNVRSREGLRTIDLVDFHRLPGATPEKETVLAPGDLILSVDLPKHNAEARSHYRKVRDRASYAFALVSVAAVLLVRNSVVEFVRIALGGVAPKPWRAFRAEAFLLGREVSRSTLEKAAAMEFAEATRFEHNSFKPELAQRTMVSVLEQLAAPEVRA